jgi:hypothetical protein
MTSRELITSACIDSLEKRPDEVPLVPIEADGDQGLRLVTFEGTKRSATKGRRQGEQGEVFDHAMVPCCAR